MANYPRIFVYLTLLLTTLFLPNSLANTHLSTIIKPSWQKKISKSSPQLTASKFSLASDIIEPSTTVEAFGVDATSSGVVSNCGDNSYANYIYMHESGCSTTVTNAEGCIGIGQACPASKLESACPQLDYTCENAYFTAYANSVYGGWYQAYLAWLAQSWW